MNTDGTGFSTCKERHKSESPWNHTTTEHEEGEQLEDRRNVGESSCNCGDGTDQRVQSLMFMMMMMMIMMKSFTFLCRFVLCASLSLSLHMFHFVLCFFCSRFALCFVPLCSHVLLCALCRCVHICCFVFLASYYGEAKTSHQSTGHSWANATRLSSKPDVVIRLRR